MATIVMTYPLDGGTYATNVDGTLVPFQARGYVDAPTTVVSLYEDATGALLGSVTSSGTPDAAGQYQGWYPWAVWVAGWSASGGMAAPSVLAPAVAGAVRLTATLNVPYASAPSAVGGLTWTTVNLLPLYGVSMTAAAGGISLPDIVAPVITAFDIPATSGNLTVAITTLTATDAVGVTGWVVKESSSTPAPGDFGTKPTSFTFATEGSKTLYAWARDDAGNISSPSSDTCAVSTAPSLLSFYVKYAPSAIASQTNLSAGGVTVLQQDPDVVPDAGSWLQSSSGGPATNVRVSFTTALGTLRTGADLQEFRARAWCGAVSSGTSPTARIELWQNGVLVSAGSEHTLLPAYGEVISYKWDASTLPDPTSITTVECKVVGTPGTASGIYHYVGDIQYVAYGSEGVEFREDFTGTANTLPNATYWDAPVTATGTGVVAFKLTGAAGTVNGTRVAAANVNVSYIPTVNSFVVAPGRRIKANIAWDSSTPVRGLFLLGNNGTNYLVGLYYYGGTNPGLQVFSPLDAATPTYYGAASAATNNGQIEFRWTDATTVELWHHSLLVTTLTGVDLGGGFKLGFGFRALSNYTVNVFADWIEIGGY